MGPQARYSYLREEIVKYERTYKAMHGGALPTKKQYDPLVYKLRKEYFELKARR